MNYPINKRNEMLKKVFIDLGYEVKLLGDKNQPKIMIDNSFVLNGFVKNKIYNFTDRTFGGNIIKTINLNTPNISKEEFEKIINDFEQRKFFKIKYNNTNLYYLKTENQVSLFTKEDCRYFFDEDKLMNTYRFLLENNDVIIEKSTKN